MIHRWQYVNDRTGRLSLGQRRQGGVLEKKLAAVHLRGGWRIASERLAPVGREFERLSS